MSEFTTLYQNFVNHLVLCQYFVNFISFGVNFIQFLPFIQFFFIKYDPHYFNICLVILQITCILYTHVIIITQNERLIINIFEH